MFLYSLFFVKVKINTHISVHVQISKTNKPFRYILIHIYSDANSGSRFYTAKCSFLIWYRYQVIKQMKTSKFKRQDY